MFELLILMLRFEWRVGGRKLNYFPFPSTVDFRFPTCALVHIVVDVNLDWWAVKMAAMIEVHQGFPQTYLMQDYAVMTLLWPVHKAVSAVIARLALMGALAWGFAGRVGLEGVA